MPDPKKQFSALKPSLHPLLLRSLAQLGFLSPTAVQEEVIKSALGSNRDILTRSKTGSGKTLAYGIPIIQSILLARDAANGVSDETGSGVGTKALILVPTRELAEQVKGQIGRLITGLGLEGQSIGIVNISGDAANKKRRKNEGNLGERMLLSDKPEIVVATPSRALAHLRDQNFTLASLTHLVIDEVDLILTYGHSSDDIKALLSGQWGLPSVYQSFLMSATLTGQVEELKGIVLRDPVVLKIEDKEDEWANLSQFYVTCTEEEKFLLLYVLLKLKLIKGKCLIFVNDTDRGYRVKLYLEKFGIKSGVLNSELPFNSRYHAVQEFNRGVFDYLIATDESGLEGNDRDDEQNKADTPTILPTQPTDATEPEPESAPASASAPKSKKRKRQETTSSSLTEYGVSRGIDFIDVSCVLNFDLPFSSRAYTHRIGRTARAGKTGTSLSFVVPRALWGKIRKNDVCLESARKDEAIWKRILEQQNKRGGTRTGDVIKEWVFDGKQVEGFRYRMEDALRSVTKSAVKEARIKEIKQEVLNSEALKAHFEDNPKDLAFLRHDKPLHPSRVQSHLKHVPNYLIPRIASVDKSDATPAESLNIPFNKPNTRKNKGKPNGRGKPGSSKRVGKRSDPLKGGKFSFKSKK